MSTRSGKSIHLSFPNNTLKSEPDLTKSERKTRSQHVKENLEELHVSSKTKKRHYVGYPGEDTGAGSVDSKDMEDDGKTSRVLRRTALKERNVTTSTESAEPSVAGRQSLRSTRKTRKFPANFEETPAVTTQDQSNNVDNQKPKKGKKKKGDQDLVENVVAVKKKSKKKKGKKRSSSIVVEDIAPVTPSGLNKSNMSVDSFHSAAGSPRDTETHEKPASSLEKDHKVNDTVEINEITQSETGRTRSAMNLDTTLTNDIVTVKEPSIKWSSVKNSLDSTLKGASFKNDSLNKTSTRELRKRKSSVKDVAMVSPNDTKDDKQSTFDVANWLDSRTSIKNDTFDKTLTPNKINTTFDKDAEEIGTSAKKGKKKKSIAENLNAPDNSLKVNDHQDNAVINTTFENNQESIQVKKMKSDVDLMIETTEKISPKSGSKFNKRNKSNRNTSSVIDTQPSSEAVITKENKIPIIDSTFKLNETSPFKSTPIKLTEDTKNKSAINTTYEKDEEPSSDIEANSKKNSVNTTFDIMECSSQFKSANEMSSPLIIDGNDLKYKSVINTTYEKDSDTETKIKSTVINNVDKNIQKTEIKINTTFEKEQTGTAKYDDVKNKRKSLLRLSSQKITDLDANNTFDIDSKNDATFDKESKSSLISSDNSMITLDKSDASRISITSDESKTEENIVNTTPLLIESSLDESRINITPPKIEIVPPGTPLKREGTFTKDEPEVISSPKPKCSKTPTKQESLPSAGFTPFHINKSSSKEKSGLLNVTRSLEKSTRSSLAEPLPRTTKVMFCSPVNNPALVVQNKGKVIKSNLKGSNKSFIFDDSASGIRASTRKRSYTHGDADDARAKRERLADDMQQSVDRLSRPRASGARAESATPSQKAGEARVPRTKLPNFAALHQRQFDRMESLGECQRRRATRARRLLTPTGALHALHTTSPDDKVPEPEKPKEAPKKPETPVKSLPTLKSINPGYTRFGFKLNMDVNPFSIPSKSQPKPQENKPNGLRKVLPSLTGTTSLRREVAKQTVMREKSFTGRRDMTRTENRTVIKGVRTNRRFELQMKMRNI